MTQNTRLTENGQKGAHIRKLGYQSSIHALSPEIKQELDTLLKQGQSPADCLRQLAQKYPNTHLPSKTAVYTYRKAYLHSSHEEKKWTVSEYESELFKMQLVVMENIKRFLATDFPNIRQKWLHCEETNDKPGEVQKHLYQYLQAVRVTMESVPKLNINIHDTYRIAQQEKAEVQSTELEGTMEHLILRYGKQIGIKYGKKVTIEDLPGWKGGEHDTESTDLS